MDESPGQIITFYSYKGGTGRTMALTNVACLLAQRQAEVGGKGVLMIDWDLEAPGLHRYFQGRLKRPGSYHSGDNIDEAEGLIDIFCALDEATRSADLSDTGESAAPNVLGSELLAKTALDKVKPEKYALETKIEKLYLIKAGRFSKKDPETYSRNVNTFNWEQLYRRSPMLIRLLAERLAATYQYVLIDSRTGITDISGICTMLLPEKLVAVFTPNSQSLRGALELIRRATDYRRESHDLRPLTVFPLVSRVEANEPRLREKWRFGNRETDTAGYQPEFEKLFNEIYNRSDVKLEDYFDEMQIQHIPYYAYGEEIAVLVERIGDKFSLRRSYKSFANRLVHSKVPWGKIDVEYEEPQSYTPSLSERLGPMIYFFRRHLAQILVIGQCVALILAFSAWKLWQSADHQRRDADEQRRHLTEQRLDAERELQIAKDKVAEYENKLPVDIIKQKDDQIKTYSDQLAKYSDQINAENREIAQLRSTTQQLNQKNAEQETTLQRVNQTALSTQQKLDQANKDLSNANENWESSRLANKACQDELKKLRGQAQKRAY
jgi:cellulose biosynthesis protein BcsQ